MSETIYFMADTGQITGEGKKDMGPVNFENLEYSLAGLACAEDKVIDTAEVRVRYTFPIGTIDPLGEKGEQGWVFVEKAPNDKYFTRKDLAAVIGKRYTAIYAEEEKTSPIAPEKVLYGRNTTAGRYCIWGYFLEDLRLYRVIRDTKTGECRLGITA